MALLPLTDIRQCWPWKKEGPARPTGSRVRAGPNRHKKCRPCLGPAFACLMDCTRCGLHRFSRWARIIDDCGNSKGLLWDCQGERIYGDEARRADGSTQWRDFRQFRSGVRIGRLDLGRNEEDRGFAKKANSQGFWQARRAVGDYGCGSTPTRRVAGVSARIRHLASNTFARCAFKESSSKERRISTPAAVLTGIVTLGLDIGFSVSRPRHPAS